MNQNNGNSFVQLSGQKDRENFFGLTNPLAGLVGKCFQWRKKKELVGYATALECMDGRMQGAVRKWAKRTFGIKYVDIITQPGMNKVLADSLNAPILENISQMLWISIGNHKSRTIIIGAHHNCLGNPAEKRKQLEDLKEAERTVRIMINSLPLHQIGVRLEDITITLIWVSEKWMPEVVTFGELQYVT